MRTRHTVSLTMDAETSDMLNELARERHASRSALVTDLILTAWRVANPPKQLPLFPLPGSEDIETESHRTASDELAWASRCPTCLVGPDQQCLSRDTGEGMGARLHAARYHA